jgi:heme exporter protein B
MTTFWASVTIFRKDLRAETRSRELLGTMLLFALLSVLVFSFALELNAIARREAISGVLWVTVVFASVLGLNRSMAQEREQGNMDALLLAPVPRHAILLGKFMGNYALAVLVGLVILPVMTVLYNARLFSPSVLVVLLLGAWGICITGTLLSAMTVQARGGEALLPVALLPVALPILLAAVRATTALFNDAPYNEWSSWLPIILAINVFYTVVCVAVFRYVVEE